MKQAIQNETIAPEKTTPIKCVVWDLDNTLWEGILLENDKIAVNEAALNLLKTLDDRGIINSIASRNDADAALAKLRSFGIEEYFLYPQVNWGSKSDSINTIQKKLNIGIDTIAFIDDQPFERDEVNFHLPEVRCFDADNIPTLVDNTAFIPRFITKESSQRREMYLNDEKRENVEKQLNNTDEFLRSLQMKLTIKPANNDDLERIEELTIRTNQLNATGYTYSYDELRQFIDSDNHKVYVCELVDSYGTYGKIGIAMLEGSGTNWTIKLLLVSCRVMSRGVGSVLLGQIMDWARKEEYTLFAEFMPTDRNRAMLITYRLAGFDTYKELPSGGLLLQHKTFSENNYTQYLDVNFIK